MAAFLDNCRFNPTLGGTTDWTYSSAVAGYQSPAAAGAVNGRLYKYFAVDGSNNWELGEGAYNTTGPVLARTTITANSLGTTAKINFAAAPQVAIVAIKADLISVEEANSFTTTQKKQVQSNILVARTSTVLTSGSGTYTLPTGCLHIRVRLIGAGGGGQGSGSTRNAGTAGGNSTFGTSLLVANGGAGGSDALFVAGGTASGGDINITGGNAGGATGSTTGPGNNGAGGPFGGQGSGGVQGGAGSAAAANSGAGGGAGGGGGAGVTAGGAGGAGGYCEKTIASPSATYSYAVGANGAGGAAGTGGFAGANGGSGIIIIEEYYGS